MKHKIEMVLQIEGKFGSEFQKTNAEQSLGLMLQAWQKHVKEAHKKNKIEITRMYESDIQILSN